MKVLVTGGAGFIGSNLVDALIEQNHSVRIIDDLSGGKEEYVNKRAEFFKKDIRRIEDIKPLFEGINTVFHCAALPRIQPSIKDPISSHENNVTGTLNVLIASKEAGVKKFIYSASSSAYGNQETLPLCEDMKPDPLNPYAMNKYFGEVMCSVFHKVYGLPTVALRYFNVYGPRQSSDGAYATVIGIFLREKKLGNPLPIVPNGEQRRAFTHVTDVVRANINAMNSPNVGSGEIINIGSETSYSVNEIAKLIGGETMIIDERLGEITETRADLSRARMLINWDQKVTFEEGVAELKRIHGIN